MTDTPSLLPEWSDFERDYVLGGVPHLFVVRSKPHVAVLVDQGGSRIGARFEILTPLGLVLPITLAEIRLEEIVHDGRRHLEIWTGAGPLFANFFRLISEIVVDVVQDGALPDVALQRAVARWEQLLSRRVIMSEEVQIGLFGELWLLDRLISIRGPEAIDAWVGPIGQAHDFRWGDVELEVKTTTGSKRVHTINGVGQLEPSIGCSLYLLSLKLIDAGTGGRSLPESVNAIELKLSLMPQALLRFKAAISAVGYSETDVHLYRRRRRLRDDPLLIEVRDGAPRLTADVINAIESRFVPERIGKIVYTIDVDGLGVSDGSSEFHQILPPAPAPPEHT